MNRTLRGCLLVVLIAVGTLAGLAMTFLLDDPIDRLTTAIAETFAETFAEPIADGVISARRTITTINLWPAEQLGGVVGRAVRGNRPPALPRVTIATPITMPGPIATATMIPIVTATASPAQLYITCQDGTAIVGTSTDGACRERGGVRAASTQRPG